MNLARERFRPSAAVDGGVGASDFRTPRRCDDDDSKIASTNRGVHPLLHGCFESDIIVMSEKQTEEQEETHSSHDNDLVIRDGFPALKRTDGKGPLIAGKEPLPRTPFASYANALHIPDEFREVIQRDCEKVFTARTIEDDEAYSAGTTYFVPAVMKARCALEGLALQIFQAHVKGLEGMYNPEQSGAEWWTLVLDAKKPKNANGEEDDDYDDDEVGMHFDADYGLEDQMPNILLHPRVATVTYLSNVGAPTLVLDKHSPPPSDPERKSLNGDIRRGWLSGPQYGKHVAFDGRLLHGAPALFFPGSSLDSKPENGDEHQAKRRKTEEMPEKRITFLVNVWVNHCPMDAEPLDDDICLQMETPWEVPDESKKSDYSYKPPFEWKNPDLCHPDRTEKVALKASKNDPAGTDEIVVCEHLVTFSFGPSMEDLHAVSKKTANGSSIELAPEEGAMSLEVGEKVKEDEQDDAEDDSGRGEIEIGSQDIDND